MSDVFISYSRKDSEFVRRLYAALTAAAREAWVDWEDIPITAEWWSEIERGIEAADSFLFVISPDSVISKVCNQEIEHAVAHNKRLIPVVRRDIMGESVNKALARHNWLYAREQDDFDRAVQQLIDVLNTDLEYVRAHTRLLVRAREWDSQHRDASYLLHGSDLLAAESWLAESGGKEPKPTEIQTQYVLASRRAASLRQRTVLAAVTVALTVTVILALAALGLFGLAESRRQESDMRGTAVAQQAATATNALGLSEVRGTQVAQGAATAVAAQATSERRAVEWRSLAWAVASGQALAAENTDLALALALQANSVDRPPEQAQAALVAAAYAPGTGMLYDGQHSDWIAALAVSPDDRWLLSAGYDGKFVLWDAASGEIVQTASFGEATQTVVGVTIALGSVTSIAFNPVEPQPVAALAHTDGTLRLWDVAAWRERASVYVGAYLNAVAFSPDASLIALGSNGAGDNLSLWDARTLTPVRVLVGHTDNVVRVAFSADGARLLSASDDGTLRLWDTAGGDLLRTLSLGGSSDAGRGLAFTAPLEDGTLTAISATNTGLIVAWNLATGEEIRRYEVGSRPPALSDITLSVDGRFLVSAALDNILYLWDTATGQLLRRFIGHSAPLMQAAFSRDGRSIFTASQDGTLRRWHAVGAGEVRRFGGGYPNGTLSRMALSPDGSRALTGGGTSDPALVLWDLTTGQIIRRLEGHTDSVSAVAFSPDGTRGLSGSFDGTLREWDLATGEPLHLYDLDALLVPSVAYSADGSSALVSVISGAFLPSGWAALIDLDSGAELKRYDPGDELVTSAVYNHDQTRILLGGSTIDSQGAISLWDAASGDLIRTFAPGHSSAVSAVTLSADGTQALSAGQDFNVILWDVAAGTEIRRFVGHTDVVGMARFSPDERLIITGSFDGTVGLWNVDTGEQILRFDDDSGEVRSVAFAPDGETAYSASRSGAISQWLVVTASDRLRGWLPGHRYVRELTCPERAQHRVEPLCPA